MKKLKPAPKEDRIQIRIGSAKGDGWSGIIAAAIITSGALFGLGLIITGIIKIVEFIL